jgi:hypothetical protein
MHRFIFAALAAALVLLPACGTNVPRVTHVTVLSAGSLVQGIHAEHQRVYSERAAAVRAGLADGGTVAQYREQMVPADAEFYARRDALASLSGALYTAAAVNDAVRQGASLDTLRPVAARLLQTFAATIPVLERGTFLPRVSIPAEVRGVISMLELVAGVR